MIKKKKSSTIYQGFPYSSVGKKVCLQCKRLWFQFLGQEDPLEKGQATHSSVRASLVAQLGKNPPAMREPGSDPWVGKILWRRKQLPTPVFWPGELHGLYSSWGRKESAGLRDFHFHHIPSSALHYVSQVILKILLQVGIDSATAHR